MGMYMRAARKPVDEVIWRPRAGELHLAVLHHGAGGCELVLITLHILAIDEMRDIENYFARFGEAAAHFLVQRDEEPVHLEADGASPCLTFALAGSSLAKIGEVFAAHLVRGKVGVLASTATVVYEDLEVHLGLAAEFIDIAEELPLVGPDGSAKGFVVVENSAESEGKNGGELKAISDDPGMIHARFLVESFARVVLADDNGQVTGWVKENLISADAVH
jgi:hypothetical protein